MKLFFAPDLWPFIAVAVLWWLLSLTPVIYSSYIAIFKKPALPRRFLFVGVVVAMSYGFLLFFFLTVTLPLSAFDAYIAPQLTADGQLTVITQGLLTASRTMSDWGYIAVPFVLAISSFKLIRYLTPRWQLVVAGLGA